MRERRARASGWSTTVSCTGDTVAGGCEPSGREPRRKVLPGTAIRATVTLPPIPEVLPSMRRRLARLAATTGVALTVAVMTATPADARRNLGGTVPADAICLTPGSAQARSDVAGSG